ncbi:inositol monophosphatase 1 isoform X3 [Prionailurus iriomotensis]
MKPNGEDEEAPAGGPWEECFEAAVQLALRAGQDNQKPTVKQNEETKVVSVHISANGPVGKNVQSLSKQFDVYFLHDSKTSVHLLYARIIRKALSEEKRVSTKTSAADLVTETDHLVEGLIISELQKRFPSHRFIAEEAAAAGAKCVLTPSPTWIVDPIDGTCNFVHRFPTVAVSIGFAVNQELEFGVIYHCTEERLYTGRRGRGAFCNGQRLRVSGETDSWKNLKDTLREFLQLVSQKGLLGTTFSVFLRAHSSLSVAFIPGDPFFWNISKALVLTEIGPKRDPATLKLFLSNMERLLHAKAHGVRVIGSSTLALCHLASGAADAYYQFGLHCWDLAAATVIIREAGGIVMDTSEWMAAGTREMATLIAQALQTINYGRDDEK